MDVDSWLGDSAHGGEYAMSSTKIEAWKPARRHPDTYPGDLSDLSTVFAMQADIAMKPTLP